MTPEGPGTINLDYAFETPSCWQRPIQDQISVCRQGARACVVPANFLDQAPRRGDTV